MGNSKKPWIILLTHGRWGEELITSTKDVIGEIHNICSFSLLSEMKVKDYINKIKGFLNQLSSRAIVVTDLYCGSTTNVALMLSENSDIDVITGLNMHLLIQLDELRNENPLYIEKDLEAILEENTGKCQLIKITSS